MNTLGWGPPGWDFLFLVAIDAMERTGPNGLTAFENDRQTYIEFFTEATARILPCIHCRNAWTKFNDPDKRQCINGCWGSILAQFLSVAHPTNNENILVIWLYLMKNKVKNKLIHQEDESMHNEILEFIKKLPNGRINANEKRILEENINKEKNIKRVDRSDTTYDAVYKKYKLVYDLEKETPMYFTFLFAIAFNAGWSKEGTTGKRRIEIPEIRQHYIDYFSKYLSKVAPSTKLRNVLKSTPTLSDITQDPDHALAKWLHNVFMTADIVCDRYLPKNFEKVKVRYGKWRVSCSKDNDLLKTCRSSTPNRYAPLHD
jgi:hypothetical protein